MTRSEWESLKLQVGETVVVGIIRRPRNRYPYVVLSSPIRFKFESDNTVTFSAALTYRTDPTYHLDNIKSIKRVKKD